MHAKIFREKYTDVYNLLWNIKNSDELVDE